MQASSSDKSIIKGNEKSSVMTTKKKIISITGAIFALALALFIYFKFYFVFGEGVKAGELNFVV